MRTDKQWKKQAEAHLSLAETRRQLAELKMEQSQFEANNALLETATDGVDTLDQPAFYIKALIGVIGMIPPDRFAAVLKNAKRKRKAGQE